MCVYVCAVAVCVARMRGNYSVKMYQDFWFRYNFQFHFEALFYRAGRDSFFRVKGSNNTGSFLKNRSRSPRKRLLIGAKVGKKKSLLFQETPFRGERGLNIGLWWKSLFYWFIQVWWNCSSSWFIQLFWYSSSNWFIHSVWNYCFIWFILWLRYSSMMWFIQLSWNSYEDWFIRSQRYSSLSWFIHSLWNYWDGWFIRKIWYSL